MYEGRREVLGMKFTQGELTTPAKRVLSIIERNRGVSPYEVYRQTQLVASTRDAEWYCRELARVGLAQPDINGSSSWWPIHGLQEDTKADLLKYVRAPHHKKRDVDEIELDEETSGED